MACHFAKQYDYICIETSRWVKGGGEWKGLVKGDLPYLFSYDLDYRFRRVARDSRRKHLPIVFDNTVDYLARMALLMELNLMKLGK